MGKMDRHVANLPPDLTGNAAYPAFRVRSFVGHNKYDLEYSIKQKKPVYIEMVVYGQDDLSDWASQNYVLVTCSSDNDMFLFRTCGFFFLEGSPHVDWDLLRREGYMVKKWSHKWY